MTTGYRKSKSRILAASTGFCIARGNRSDATLCRKLASEASMGDGYRERSQGEQYHRTGFRYDHDGSDTIRTKVVGKGKRLVGCEAIARASEIGVVDVRPIVGGLQDVLDAGAFSFQGDARQDSWSVKAEREPQL